MTAALINITSKLNKEISSILSDSSIDKRYKTSSKNITYSSFLSNKMLMIAVIREGVPYSLFNLIQDFTPFTEENWADFLDISTKSLQRYKQTAKSFKSIQSEKIIEMSEVTNVGLDVFDDCLVGIITFCPCFVIKVFTIERGFEQMGIFHVQILLYILLYFGGSRSSEGNNR